MATTKLTDATSEKELGQKWFAIRFPEECHFWNNTKQWPTDLLKNYPIQIETIKVRARVQNPNIDPTVFNKNKNRLILKCGCEVIWGLSKTEIKKSAVFKLKPDSVVDLNRALSELCKLFGYEMFDIEYLKIYNTEAAVSTDFKRFNPNGTGVSLYAHRYFFQSETKLFSSIPFDTQMKIVGGFSDFKEICELEELTIRKAVCGGKPMMTEPIHSKRKMISVHLQ